MALTPTLFVGLGSTGAHVLRKIREYIHATYLRRDLPIFQFLVLETAPEKAGRDENGSWHFFQCEPADFNAIPDDPVYGWVNVTPLLRMQRFENGAGNVRMAGRLALFQNWATAVMPGSEAKIKAILDTAFELMRRDQNEKTIEYLKKYYIERRNLDPEVVNKAEIVNDSSRVFVVGTLCGGTASGMLWDIAYYLRFKLYMTAMEGPDKRLQGVFTIPDMNFANRNDKNYPELAANTWAVLHELDYWSRGNSNFDLLPPGQKVPHSTRARPFDHVLVVSPSGSQGRVAGDDAEAERGLNELVALYLFCHTVDKFQGALQERHVNWSDNNRLHTDSQRLCFLSTFGLSGFLFPKYNIAAAASCLLAKKVCERWQDSTAQIKKHEAETAASADWRRLLANVDQSVGEPPTTIHQHVKNFIDQQTRDIDFSNPNWASTLHTAVRDFFDQDESWDRQVRSRIEDWKNDLDHAIAKLVIGALVRYDNLEQAASYVEGLDRQIFTDLADLEQFPPEMPQAPDIGPLLRPLAVARTNLWVRLAGKRADAVEVHCRRALRLYHERLEEFATQYINYTATGAVKELQANILPRFLSQLKDPTQGMAEVVREILKGLDDLLRDYTRFVAPPDVKILPLAKEGETNVIRRESEALCTLLQASAVQEARLSRILAGHFKHLAPAEFANFPARSAAKELSDGFIQMCIDYLDKHQNLASLIEAAASQRVKATESAADLYMEWPKQLPDFPNAFSLAFVFGSQENNDSVFRLIGATQRKRIDDTVDHLVLFYNEISGFAIDDTAVKHVLETQFKSAQAERSRFSDGRFTHRGGLTFFDPDSAERAVRIENLRGEIGKWVTIAVDLKPDKLYSGQERMLFTFKTSTGVERRFDLQNSSDCQRLATQTDPAVLEEFVRRVKEAILQLGETAAAERVNQVTAKLRDLGEAEKAVEKEEFYQDILGEVFVAPAGRKPAAKVSAA
jgi:hypothetical protein